MRLSKQRGGSKQRAHNGWSDEERSAGSGSRGVNA